MPKVLLLRGLPGSGKTTTAIQMLHIDGNLARVNLDSLRNMLFGNRKWSGKQESLAKLMEKTLVMNALQNNRNVIVDDTNLRSVDSWKYFCEGYNESNDNEATLEIKDLTNVPLLTCIQRDALRKGKERVGRGVIERMALDNGLIDLSAYAKIAIIDIDGTVAEMGNRKRYLETTPKDYKNFYGTVMNDLGHPKIIEAVGRLYEAGYTIIMLSGRPTNAEGDINVGHLTAYWLTDHNVPFHHLFMRKGGDFRPDNIVKAEIFDTMLTKGNLKHWAVKIVMDDRERVCEVWRQKGLPLMKVYNGGYVSRPALMHPEIYFAVSEIPYNAETPEDF